MEVKLIARGAEADLYLEGEEIIKERVEKKYRVGQLDQKLRLERTRREVRLLSMARQQGVPTPLIKDVLPEEFTIKMEFIGGKKLKDEVPGLENLKGIFKEIGRLVGRMHSAHLTHGDLTTSNIILSRGKIYFIDFGLGEVTESEESKGTDLLVFKKSVRSTHYDREEEIWGSFLDGYSQSYESQGILKRLKLMEKRGRYFSGR